jgi:hypothetical protein
VARKATCEKSSGSMKARNNAQQQRRLWHGRRLHQAEDAVVPQARRSAEVPEGGPGEGDAGRGGDGDSDGGGGGGGGGGGDSAIGGGVETKKEHGHVKKNMAKKKTHTHSCTVYTLGIEPRRT